MTLEIEHGGNRYKIEPPYPPRYYIAIPMSVEDAEKYVTLSGDLPSHVLLSMSSTRKVAMSSKDSEKSQTANPDPRECEWCGAQIDPIDWCYLCREGKCDTHAKPRKRKDAKYCSDYCRSKNRQDLVKLGEKNA